MMRPSSVVAGFGEVSSGTRGGPVEEIHRWALLKSPPGTGGEGNQSRASPGRVSAPARRGGARRRGIRSGGE